MSLVKPYPVGSLNKCTQHAVTVALDGNIEYAKTVRFIYSLPLSLDVYTVALDGNIEYAKTVRFIYSLPLSLDVYRVENRLPYSPVPVMSIYILRVNLL